MGVKMTIDITPCVLDQGTTVDVNGEMVFWMEEDADTSKGYTIKNRDPIRYPLPMSYAPHMGRHIFKDPRDAALFAGHTILRTLCADLTIEDIEGLVAAVEERIS